MGFDSGSLPTIIQDAETGNVNGIVLDCRGLGLLGIQGVAADSWDGTLVFESSIDNSNFVAHEGVQQDNGTPRTRDAGTTLNRIYYFDVSMVAFFRSRTSGRTAGSITVTANGVAA